MKHGEDDNNESETDLSSLFVFISGKHHGNKSTNNLIVLVSVVLIVLAAGFFSFVVWTYFRMFLAKMRNRRRGEISDMYGKIEYSPLSENLEIS